MLLEIGGFSLDLRESGSGEPVVLLHSSGMNAQQWRGTIGALEEYLGPDWRFIAPNQLGYGRSGPWQPDKDIDFSDELSVLDALLAWLERPAHIVGHSLGAFLALKLMAARRDSGRLREIVSATLIEPVILGSLKAPEEAHYLADVEEMFETFLRVYEEGDTAAAIEAFTDYWYGAGTWAGIPKAQRLPFFMRAPKMYREVKAIWHDDTTVAIAQGLDLPVQIISAERTTRAGRRMSDLLLDALPEAAYHILPGAGHMAPLSHPAECARLVGEFLSAHRAGGD